MSVIGGIIMIETKIVGHNNIELFTRIWNDAKNPKAVVQVIHGMREHSGRYLRFCKMLEDNGYIVFITDSRGHGKTCPSFEKLGHGEKDIYAECVQDQINVSKHIKEKYPQLPLYVFAHSFGSMIAQKYIQLCDLADKVVLCGTNNGNNGTFKLGLFITNIQKAFVGSEKTAKLVEKTNRNLYAKKFDRGNWLTRDEQIFDAYLADPYCKAEFPISFYNSLFKHMTKVNNGIKDIKKDIKIFLIAGDQDPVGNYSKNVVSLTKLYQKHGLDATCKIYPNARHELHNETNKEEVDKDILNFFNN